MLNMKECLVLFFALVAVSFGAVIDKCHLDNMESCGRPLVDYRKEIGQRFPTTEDQVNELCERLEESQTCFDNFKLKCMTPLQQEAIKMFSEGANDVYQQFCTSGTEIRKDYLKNAGCMNEAYDSDEYKSAISYVEAAMEEMLEKPMNERMVAACCGYRWFDNESQKLGTEKCGEDSVESLNRVVKMAVSNVPEVMCDGFDPESDMCKKSLPAPGSEPKGNIRDSHLAKMISELYLE